MFAVTAAIVATAGLGAVAGPAAAQSAAPGAPGAEPAGKSKARACAACHGPQGLSTLPNAPHLAGQPEIYLVEQLKAYRSGRRTNEVMSVIAKPLSDQDIAELAAWYAGYALEVKDTR